MTRYQSDVSEATHECFCGAWIKRVDDETWIDGRGGTNCYPDSENPVDASAAHDPCEELDTEGKG